METFKDRLEIILQQKQINKSDLGKLMGVTRQSVYKYFSEDGKPTDDKVKLLAEFLNVEFNWLRYGIGTPTESVPSNTPTATLMDVSSVLETYFKEIDLIKDMLNLKQEAYRKVIFK